MNEEYGGNSNFNNKSKAKLNVNLDIIFPLPNQAKPNRKKRFTDCVCVFFFHPLILHTIFRSLSTKFLLTNKYGLMHNSNIDRRFI